MPPKKEIIMTRNVTVSRIEGIHQLAQLAAIDESKIVPFKIKYGLLAGIYDEFNQAHYQILAQTPEAELAGQEDIQKKVDELHLQILMRYEEMWPTRSSPSRESAVYNTAVQSVRLPKLELLKFSGDLKGWQTFIDVFNSSVHNCPQLSDINKFQHLIGLLNDEPLTLIKSIPLTANNYQIAYDTLVKRYSNKKLLTRYHWNTILNYPSLSSDNFKSLRQLIDVFNENLAILRNLGHKVDEWDFILTELLLGKLDTNTRKRFELNSETTALPKYAELQEFLLKQCTAMESLDNSIVSPKVKNNPVQTKPTRSGSNPNPSWRSSNTSTGNSHFKSFVVDTSPYKSSSNTQVQMALCPFCKQDHLVCRCSAFLEKSPSDRFQAAKHARLCINCLRGSHSVSNCLSSNTCRICGSKHHTLLHLNKPRGGTTSNPPVPISQESQNSNGPSRQPPTPGVSACTTVLSTSSPRTNVLLATVSLEVQNKWGNYCTIRALLDPGSQASFIVESQVNNLGLPRLKSSTPIFGLGHTSTASCNSVTACHIRPHGSSKPPVVFEAIIIKTICSNIPSSPVDPAQVERLHSLPLADPSFNKPGPIHMLLGADICPSIMVGNPVINVENQGPMAIETIFGWTLLGPLRDVTGTPVVHSFLTTVKPFPDALLKQFWEVEEVPSKPIVSPEDLIVENLFQRSHFRIPSGRFGVHLPFKNESPHFENSCSIADRRFLALEKRLLSQPILRQLYVDFMREYLSSDHMSLIDPSPHGEDTYFIPHHGVLTADGDKQKIRVVFDASAKADNNVSLNDTLYPGPKLQSNINTVLLRFRSHEIVFTCDIRQMYRQILIVPDQRKYQLIRWRFDPSESIQTYQLNTVTYGVNSSPYLAIRTLHQLAEEGKSRFPLASEALLHDTYVDDLVCGMPSEEAAIQLRDQLISLLRQGCFELRKWSSNRLSILKDIPGSHLHQPRDFDNDSADTMKILGLQWHSKLDSFSFKVSTKKTPCTKRSILSEVARIYDPLGFLSPITLFAKHLLQHLWTLGLEWDGVPPEDVIKVWLQYKDEMASLSSLRIPRHLSATSLKSCQLHAFCDASEAGYAGVVYFRLVDPHNLVATHLVMAKSKVTPLKRLSIPRLELCAAVLLAKLVEFVLDTYKSILHFDQVIAWSDSVVALTWIRSSPHRWKTFIANRTNYIQERLSPTCWRYVPSAENPADPASRGMFPKEVLSCSLWWAGPAFLRHPPNLWPSEFTDTLPPDVNLEERTIVLLAQCQDTVSSHVLEQFSSLRKIQGIIAYVLRFVCNLRHKPKVTGALSHEELHQSLLCLVKMVQAQVFSEIIEAVRHHRRCPKQFQSLSPFLDEQGILRVGGRISNADLAYSAKHPALLPRQHRLTELIIHHTHNTHLHPGINTTMYLLQQNFWVLSSRRAVRHYLSQCNRCFRAHPTSYTPPMGDLPKARISQIKPFRCVGVDYAGPFPLTLGRTRGAKVQKGYLCLFVCFATKAIHLELASDLSTAAFLAALQRMIARRGRCSQIFSDCGTNFVGAHRELNKLMQASVEAENITWSFNPPSAPHFGGLWESGVKAVKTHFYRVIGDQILTYEEMNTLFIQIEAILNSRPLCSLSTDPNDLCVLTPGHFLTLEPVSSAPDPDLSHLSLNRLSRWQLIQYMQQKFWARWKTEYLHTLYQRSKWSQRDRFQPPSVGTLVLIKDNLSPPLKWRLGRITDLHSGHDGVARVASVLTANGTIKRPLVKLCALPSQ